MGLNHYSRYFRKNDWGHLIYEPEDPRAGSLVNVEWKDGTITSEVISRKEYTERVSDMGHESTATSWEYGFHITHRGHKSWVEITEVLLK